MCGNKSCNKFCGILLGLIVLIAIVLAACASFMSPDNLGYIIAVSRFFDVMLPVLAVGALFKFIFTKKGCCCGSNGCGDKKEGSCS